METDHAITTTPPSSTTLTGGHTKGLDPGIIALCSLVVVGLFALLTWLFGSGVCRKPIKQCVNKYCPGCLKTADVENPQSSSSQQQNRDSSECERLEVHGQTHQGSAEDLVPGTGSPNDETDRSTLLNQTRSSDRHTERSEISEEIHGQTLQGSADDLIPVTSSPSEISALLNQTRSSDSLTERSELIEDCGGRPLTEAEHQREDMAMANDKMKDIYFVSSSDETPHVQKMKDMFQRNGWTFTSKFDAPLGEPVMNYAEEAVRTHKHIVVLFDEGDFTNKIGEDNMTMEMAFLSLGQNEIGRKIIPIRCCDKKLVPFRLGCLRGRAINDDDLEKKMIQAIGKGI
ncbi:uncharacterized protein LOC121423115 isoform X2 [Lytechinus variegatus]|uniref:uncharacterized protein LOC121423115 isoform X2 n=1 Tax=Lytechinus variegatus TaxID=7654 RepID=UPI001BB18559|nr:uncharacterized protein LOC121423115 isoform X2 [Lytechinus variegatus]